MTDTERAARLRSALEAALVALEVAADPANDIDPDGFEIIARTCRAALEETNERGAPAFNACADRSERALNRRDVLELSLGSIAGEVRS